MQRDAFHCLQSRLGMGADNVGSGGWSWLRRTFAIRHLGVWKVGKGQEGFSSWVLEDLGGMPC